ncbi:hypothetical protein EV401DRAFT_2228209 [Pisolithus croceorrhizus]|nr:hypothetical protein EV401DRAFT_2228209 [Pisolithus croceorrhizus]
MTPTPPPVELTPVVPGRQSPELLSPRQSIDTAWGSIRNDGTTSRIRKQKPVQPPETEPETPPSRNTQSWATWLPDPSTAPTPPPVEPPPVALDRRNCFGSQPQRKSHSAVSTIWARCKCSGECE